MEDRSWLYQSGDALAHFKGVSVFLETIVQHATHEKEETIYCPCKLCNNNVMYLYKDRELIHEHLVWSCFIYNYFFWSKHNETQSRTENIIDERVEESMKDAYHVYSHHDDGGENDVGQDDEGEELIRNVATDVLL
jgi:hypothetical protein